MIFVAQINKAGQAVIMSMPNHTLPRAMTPKAFEYLLLLLEKQGSICKTCGTVARASELADGVCNSDTGCGQDPDVQMIMALPESERGPAQLALTKVGVQLFARNILDNGEAGPSDRPPKAHDYGQAC